MKFKNLLANKNVVTILGALLMVVVLYLFYNWRVNQAINPIYVPYAKVEIGPRTEITRDMIATVEIQQSALRGNVLTNENTQIIGMYTNVNTTIPAGSMFYKEALVRADELADSWVATIPDGMVPFTLPVDILSTSANSIYPGKYIDISVSITTSEGRILTGILYKDVKVSAVKDGDGNHVFETNTESRTPAFVIIGVTPEMDEILSAATVMSNAKITLKPKNVVIENENSEINPEVSSEAIQSYIQQQMGY